MLPSLTPIPQQREMTDVFGGYNHNLSVGDGEFYEMENLSSDNYPVLSTRRKRGAVKDSAYVIYGEGDPPTEIKQGEEEKYFVGQIYENRSSGEKYVYEGVGFNESDEKFYTWKKYYYEPSSITSLASGVYPYNEYWEKPEEEGDGEVGPIDPFLTTELKEQLFYLKNRYLYRDGKLEVKRYITSPVSRPIHAGYENNDVAFMGVNLVFGSGTYYNLENLGKNDVIWKEFESVASTVTMCNKNGKAYSVTNISETAPSDPTDETLWIDTSDKPHVLKKYSTKKAMWISVATTYLKIEATGIGEAFSEGDGVELRGAVFKGTEVAGNYVLTEVGEDKKYIIVPGFTDNVLTGAITVERKMPVLDAVFESGNRLWGCRYGLDETNGCLNEIYASKLGDFKNWYCFAGTSTDSYTASVGVDGPFTGAVNFNGRPLFMKEDCIIQIYGMYPAAYQMQTTPCSGAEFGSEHSLVVDNGILYYKGKDAVYAYDGSMPVNISYQLGDVSEMRCTSACAYNHKLYFIMQEAKEDARPVLYIYDTQRQLWHKETFDKRVTGAHDLCEYGGKIYYVETIDEGERIRELYGESDETVEWMAETGILGVGSPDKKYISRLNVRMSLAIGSRVTFYAQYDSSGSWEPLCTMKGTGTKTFTLPIRPRRCDHFRLRISGQGEAKIFSITKTIMQGSDRT